MFQIERAVERASQLAQGLLAFSRAADKATASPALVSTSSKPNDAALARRVALCSRGSCDRNPWPEGSQLGLTRDSTAAGRSRVTQLQCR